MLMFKSSDMLDSTISVPHRSCFSFVSLFYCPTSSHARILCATTPSGGLISEQKPYVAFRFAVFMALLFPSELIHSSMLVVWGYVGWPIFCLMSSETKILKYFGYRTMIFVMGRDQLPESMIAARSALGRWQCFHLQEQRYTNTKCSFNRLSPAETAHFSSDCSDCRVPWKIHS